MKHTLTCMECRYFLTWSENGKTFFIFLYLIINYMYIDLVGTALTKEPVVSEIGQYKIPKRKRRDIQHKQQYVQSKILVEVNYLPLTFTKPDLRVFHYDVTFNPDRPKGLFRLILFTFYCESNGSA